LLPDIPTAAMENASLLVVSLFGVTKFGVTKFGVTKFCTGHPPRAIISGKQGIIQTKKRRWVNGRAALTKCHNAGSIKGLQFGQAAVNHPAGISNASVIPIHGMPSKYSIDLALRQ
jgi:hypothetical protein